MEPWHLDRKVPIALITAICFQSFAAIWWAASVSSQVNQQQKDIDNLVFDNKGNDEVITRMEENVKEVNRVLTRLENGQDKVNVLLQQLLSQGK